MPVMMMTQLWEDVVGTPHNPLSCVLFIRVPDYEIRENCSHFLSEPPELTVLKTELWRVREGGGMESHGQALAFSSGNGLSGSCRLGLGSGLTLCGEVGMPLSQSAATDHCRQARSRCAQSASPRQPVASRGLWSSLPHCELTQDLGPL